MPALSRASTSLWTTKTWMAGTSPAMTAPIGHGYRPVSLHSQFAWASSPPRTGRRRRRLLPRQDRHARRSARARAAATTRSRARWRGSSASTCPAIRSSWCATWRAPAASTAANILLQRRRQGRHPHRPPAEQHAVRAAPSRPQVRTLRRDPLQLARHSQRRDRAVRGRASAAPVDTLGGRHARARLTVGAAGDQLDARIPRAPVQRRVRH